MKKIILASQSPRRRELLKQIGVSFEVIPSYMKETIDPKGTITEKIEMLALEKAIDVAKEITEEALVIGADTVVVLDKILGKPSSQQEARNMLQSLAGKTHQVISGISIIDTKTQRQCTAHQVTYVKMREYGVEEINNYIASGECWDKAGSYAIQGLGALFVEEIKGDYFNVVGLPLGLLNNLLKTFGVNILASFIQGES